MTDQVLEVFDLIREYAERHDWLPIGWRTFTVGDWRVTVNGSSGLYTRNSRWRSSV
jgi:hypothetical protein